MSYPISYTESRAVEDAFARHPRVLACAELISTLMLQHGLGMVTKDGPVIVNPQFQAEVLKEHWEPFVRDAFKEVIKYGYVVFVVDRVPLHRPGKKRPMINIPKVVPGTWYTVAVEEDKCGAPAYKLAHASIAVKRNGHLVVVYPPATSGRLTSPLARIIDSTKLVAEAIENSVIADGLASNPRPLIEPVDGGIGATAESIIRNHPSGMPVGSACGVIGAPPIGVDEYDYVSQREDLRRYITILTDQVVQRDNARIAAARDPNPYGGDLDMPEREVPYMPPQHIPPGHKVARRDMPTRRTDLCALMERLDNQICDVFGLPAGVFELHSSQTSAGTTGLLDRQQQQTVSRFRRDMTAVLTAASHAIYGKSKFGDTIVFVSDISIDTLRSLQEVGYLDWDAFRLRAAQYYNVEPSVFRKKPPLPDQLLEAQIAGKATGGAPAKRRKVDDS